MENVGERENMAVSGSAYYLLSRLHPRPTPRPPQGHRCVFTRSMKDRCCSPGVPSEALSGAPSDVASDVA